MPNAILAHSSNKEGAHQSLLLHLAGVAVSAKKFASAFGEGDAGRTAGLLHDIGKARTAWQERLAALARRVDAESVGYNDARHVRQEPADDVEGGNVAVWGTHKAVIAGKWIAHGTYGGKGSGGSVDSRSCGRSCRCCLCQERSYIQSAWARETALHPLAVHFCSIQCKDEYLARLFGTQPVEEVVVESTAQGEVIVEREVPAKVVTKTRRVRPNSRGL